ncbi:chorismate mutase [Fusobacterium necrophorum subsp. funduliforme B35]|uniref:Chorismate mutase n=1 Tax=Fusobacterium necrophorum subsp. funduliforme B35 TaxID=1226633 RepID=A0A0B4FQL4_9FUSO|nr:chorismate mutase [Fusobacterium necrophorum subsp. funduliforme B35]
MDTLEIYREQMNCIDQEMARLFLQRMKLSIQIGDYKKQKRLPIFQKEREDIVLEKVKQIASTTEEKNIWKIFFSIL